MDEETYLRNLLADLQAEYRARSKPIIDALVEIEARKPPSIIHIPALALISREIEAHISRVLNEVWRMNGGRLPGDPPQWPCDVRVGKPSR